MQQRRDSEAKQDWQAPLGQDGSMLPTDTADLRKARGAFFTPPAVARFITEWAVRADTDDIIEPSCGEAVFLHQLPKSHAGRVVGVEIHHASAREAQRTLRREGIKADVHARDFFTSEEFGQFDAAVGNPPYVRYQGWTGAARSSSRQAALRAGVNLTNLASSWAAFTVHSALHLRPGGRLGLVLPAELLTVNYAAPVRTFLMTHFVDVTLVLFEERVFPGVEVEAVLVLADGYSPKGLVGSDHMRLVQVRDAHGLSDIPGARTWRPPSTGAKWSGGMLSDSGLTAYSEATENNAFGLLQAWGETTLGMVTGNNKYFALAPAKVHELGLQPSDLIRISPPGSRHLRGLSLTPGALASLGDDGQVVTQLLDQFHDVTREDHRSPSGADGRTDQRCAPSAAPSASTSRARTSTWTPRTNAGYASHGGACRISSRQTCFLPI